MSHPITEEAQKRCGCPACALVNTKWYRQKTEATRPVTCVAAAWVTVLAERSNLAVADAEETYRKRWELMRRWLTDSEEPGIFGDGMALAVKAMDRIEAEE